jgi:DNA-binding transcriptional regulator LsrR (DeoR family)
VSDRLDLLARAASLYYEDELSQEEIARRIGTSRSTVSRLLQEAREIGVVEITIHFPWKTEPQLEAALVRRFGLHRAIVLSGRGQSYDQVVRGMGVLAARYLEAVIQTGQVISISWGQAVHSTVQALRPQRTLPITVIQMVGAVGGGDPEIDGPEVARLLARACGGEYRHLHAPLIVGDVRAHDVLVREPRIRETLALARRADLALIGIGAPLPEHNSLLRAGYLDRADLEELRAWGATGDLCARYYDAWGRELDVDLNRRVVGIDLVSLQDIGQVIGVAGGIAKADAILGALRAAHVDVLVTDETAASRVMALTEDGSFSRSDSDDD